MGNGNGDKSSVQSCERKPNVYVKVLVKCQETGIPLKNVRVSLIKKGVQVYEIKTDKSGVALFKPGEKDKLEGLYGIRFTLPDDIGRKYYSLQQKNIDVKQKPVIELFKLEPKKATIEVKVKWEGGARPGYTVHLRKDGEEDEKDDLPEPAPVAGESAMLSSYTELEHGTYVVWLTLNDEDGEEHYRIPENRTVAVEPGGREKVKIKLKERRATLEIELMDAEDHPIPEEEYEIWTMGGGARKITGGKLDKQGQAHVRDRGIVAGSAYEIRFPRYDVTDIVTAEEDEELYEEEAPEEADEPAKDYYGAAGVFFLDEKTGRATPSFRGSYIDHDSDSLNERDMLIMPDGKKPKVFYRLQRPENIESATVSIMTPYTGRGETALKVMQLGKEEIEAGEGEIAWWPPDKPHDTLTYAQLAAKETLFVELEVQPQKGKQLESLGDKAWSYIHLKAIEYGVLSVRFRLDLERSQVFASRDALDGALELMRQDLAFTPGEDTVEIEWELVGHEHIKEVALRLWDNRNIRIAGTSDTVPVWTRRVEVQGAAGKLEWDGKNNHSPDEKGTLVARDHSPFKLKLEVIPKEEGYLKAYECVANELWTYIYAGQRGPRDRPAEVEQQIKQAADEMRAKGMSRGILEARRKRLLELWDDYGGHLLHFKTDALRDAEKRQELIRYVQDALAQVELESETLEGEDTLVKEIIEKAITKKARKTVETKKAWLDQKKLIDVENPGGGACLFWSVHQLLVDDPQHRQPAHCRAHCREAVLDLRVRSVWHLQEIINNKPCDHDQAAGMDDFGKEQTGLARDGRVIEGEDINRETFLPYLNVMLQNHKEGFRELAYHPARGKDKWQWYFNRMVLPDTWGDLIMLFVISHIYKAEITYLFKYPGQADYREDIIKNFQGAPRYNWKILNEGNYHFKALMPQ